MSTHHDYPVSFTLNGVAVEASVPATKTLLTLLRDDLQQWDVKEGCGKGDCGACTVLLNGEPRLACLMLAVQSNNTTISTVQALGDEEHLHPLQEAFVAYGAVQCGFCTPGMIMMATALLERNPHPTREEIRLALSGNICRCTGYQTIIDAVEAASHVMEQQDREMGQDMIAEGR
jgi:carbon-monoxide dehydrogenase small subunit